MKSIQLILIAVLVSSANIKGFSQITSVPQIAKDNFAKQYPTAQNIKWDNDVINVSVSFMLDGASMDAGYSNKGIWKSTYEDYTYDKLPDAVKDGLKKSKYADREIQSVKKIYYPGNVEQYRLEAKKNGLQKKYLFFNPAGRLVRDAITI